MLNQGSDFLFEISGYSRYPKSRYRESTVYLNCSRKNVWEDHFWVHLLSSCISRSMSVYTKGWCMLGNVISLFLEHSRGTCTTFHRYPIFSKRYSVLCKVYTGYCRTSEIEHGLCTCTVDNPLAKARGLSLRTGAQTMLYLPQ